MGTDPNRSQKLDQVIPALVSALRDSNPEVSSDASYALCKIGIPAMPAIMASFGDAGPELSGRVEYLISEIVRGNPNLRPAGETEEQTPARIKAARFITAGRPQKLAQRTYT